MTFIKRKGAKLIFVDNGLTAYQAAYAINQEIKWELPGCIGRLKARVRNGALQIGKNSGPGKSYKWYAMYERKEIPIINLTV